MSPWPSIEPEPTDLLAPWPGASPPEVDEIVSRLAGELVPATSRVRPLPRPDDHTLWTVAIEPPDNATPLVVWSEPVRPGSIDELDDHRARACRWMVGIESVLDSDDPLGDYARQVRSLAMWQSPAVLDANCAIWHPRRTLERVFADAAAEPPAEVLWVIQAVSGSHDHGRAVWLHTHGLWRCGRLELEMLGVPEPHAPTAALLLNEVAARLLEEPAPAPGVPFAVGAGLDICLVPWSLAAAALPEEAPGSGSRRGEDPVHRGPRAALCAATENESSGHGWSWPAAVILELEAGDAAVYRSARSTRREAALATGTWSGALRAFGRLQAAAPDATLLVKAAFDRPGTADREHRWLQVDRGASVADSIEGRLLEELPGGDAPTASGPVHRIRSEQISDWLVLSGSDRYGPNDLDRLDLQDPKEGVP